MSPRLLIVSHSRTGSTTRLLEAVLEGACAPEIEGVEVVSVEALAATAEDVRAADAIICGTPENFGYMSGALKHFFDTVFYEIVDEKRGLPYGLFVKAGQDGTGAVSAIEPLVTGLGWRQIQPPVVAVGDVTDDHLEACRELGATLAAGLAYGGL